jgi:glycosyltransferase (activator-dependent family)
MRILFTPLAMRSHIQAQTQLAWALRAAGHEVVMAVRPDLLDDVERLGLTGARVGEPMNLGEFIVEHSGQADDGGSESDPTTDGREGNDESAASWEYLLGRIYGFSTAWFPSSCTDKTIDDMVELARWWRPDLVVWDPACPGGAVAARAIGAPHARLLFGTDRFGRLREWFLRRLAERDAPEQLDPYRDWLAPHLERVGEDFAEDMAVGRFTIDPAPAGVRRATGVHYVPMRYVPHNGTVPLPDWLAETPERPRVCLTLGWSHQAVESGGGALRDLLDAVADLDAEIVATTSPDHLAPGITLPENVRPVGYVPLGALLPSCAAIVHHGGAGTVATAWEHGVPQVVAPSIQVPEERHWGPTDFALWVAERRAGVAIWHRPLAAAVGAATAAVLSDPSYARNAAQLRTEMDGMPTPTEVVPALLRLADRYRVA